MNSSNQPWKNEGRVGSRREARERAIELGYEAHTRGFSVDEILDSLPLEPEPYSIVLLRAAEVERTRADALISETATGWTIARMPAMDVLVMRLAIGEMLTTDVPTGVILAEAVDLASRYSTDESARFVNGVLSAVAKKVRT